MTDDDNPFKDLPIKMQFSRAVLPKDSRILEHLINGMGISTLEECYTEEFFL